MNAKTLIKIYIGVTTLFIAAVNETIYREKDDIGEINNYGMIVLGSIGVVLGAHMLELIEGRDL